MFTELDCKKYEPLEPQVDLENLHPNNFTQDPFLSKYRQETELFDSEIPKMLSHKFADEATVDKTQPTNEDAVNICYRYPLLRAAPPFAALAVPARPDVVLPHEIQERMEEPEFPFSESPILVDGVIEEQAQQEQLIVDLPQNEQPDNK